MRERGDNKFQTNKKTQKRQKIPTTKYRMPTAILSQWFYQMLSFFLILSLSLSTVHMRFHHVIRSSLSQACLYVSSGSKFLTVSLSFNQLDFLYVSDIGTFWGDFVSRCFHLHLLLFLKVFLKVYSSSRMVRTENQCAYWTLTSWNSVKERKKKRKKKENHRFRRQNTRNGKNGHKQNNFQRETHYCI